MSPRPEKFVPPAVTQPSTCSPEYSGEERAFLVRLAHESIAATLDGRELRPTGIPARLLEPRGAFTTLYLGDEVRGCVGYVHAAAPLYQVVIETADAAAFHDLRFMPVGREEAARLRVSISVLSPIEPICPEQIQLGKHGVVVTLGNRRGLLLPQVPIEHGWDVATLLEQTCRKAGLAPDAWQRGATLEAFTAEVFGDQPEG
jgi:uncharacterized protein